jgi:hypothetical protein
MKRMGKVVKGERKKKKRKEKCCIVLLKFYVNGAWNQKKLSIGA